MKQQNLFKKIAGKLGTDQYWHPLKYKLISKYSNICHMELYIISC